MKKLGLFSLMKCFNVCREETRISGYSTKFSNFSDKPIELQIRVGPMLKKIFLLKANSSKRLSFKNIYKDYMPSKRFMHGHDETCHPYIWINDTGNNSLRMVKQQYISLDDLREFSEMRIFRDYQRGCISVRKKPRPDYC